MKCECGHEAHYGDCSRIVIPTFISPIEYAARIATNCICGNAKGNNTLVCWDCFKRGPNPLKYSGLSYEEWLKTRKAEAI